MERIPASGVVLVDGWNLLVRLAGAPEALADPEVREEARGHLLGLFEPWAEAHRVRVVVAWDGRSPRVPGPGERVRSVGVDPPAEADDWIAHEARRLHREGVPVGVVTRDRGLIARLPRAATRLPVDRVAADLRALAGEEVRAPHVHGPGESIGEVPASPEPVDPGRLPRRRTSPEPVPAPAPAPAPAAATPDPPGRSRRDKDPSTSARLAEERARRRARWERAQRRREALRRRKKK